MIHLGGSSRYPINATYTAIIDLAPPVPRTHRGRPTARSESIPLPRDRLQRQINSNENWLSVETGCTARCCVQARVAAQQQQSEREAIGVAGTGARNIPHWRTRDRRERARALRTHIQLSEFERGRGSALTQSARNPFIFSPARLRRTKTEVPLLLCIRVRLMSCALGYCCCCCPMIFESLEDADALGGIAFLLFDHCGRYMGNRFWGTLADCLMCLRSIAW